MTKIKIKSEALVGKGLSVKTQNKNKPEYADIDVSPYFNISILF